MAPLSRLARFAPMPLRTAVLEDGLAELLDSGATTMRALAKAFRKGNKAAWREWERNTRRLRLQEAKQQPEVELA